MIYRPVESGEDARYDCFIARCFIGAIDKVDDSTFALTDIDRLKM